jgi:hypothetical protein
MIGKVPVNLVSPTLLQEMLKNVTLVLPEGCELIAGLRPNNVYLYYEVIQAFMLADVHSFKLILNVPLKSVNRQYEMYKVFVLPTRVLIIRTLSLTLGKNILVLTHCNSLT